MKRLMTAVAVGATVVVGAATLGIAGTADASTPTAAVTAPHRSGTVAWVRTHHRAIRRAVVTISASSIGVTPQDLVSELRSGKSIADVAGEHSVAVQSVVNALVSAAQARVDQAEQHGRLNSATASKITAALPGYATKLVNHVF